MFAYSINAMKVFFKIILSLSFIWVIALVASSCANIIPPGGGPRDSLPPRLILAFPKDSAVNVATNIINLTFDEYVTLQGVNENLIISPTLKNVPLVDNKLKVVTIKIKDSLEANTTYSLNFGNAIKDVNEGNILKDFTYVFSTGKKIDNYSYSGKVFLAEKGKIDTTLIVILHKILADSAILKERPRYYTKINSKGDFTFNNLSAGTFRVYVLPNDYTKKYDDSTKLFAFKNEPIVTGSNTLYDTLYVYEEFKQKVKISSPIALTDKNAKEDKRLKYTNDLESGQQDLLGNLTLTFNRKIKLSDSSKIVLSDSNFIPLKDYTLSLDTGKTKLTLSYLWKELKYFRLVIPKEAVMDSAGITLPKRDTLKFITKREADYGSIKLRFTNLNLSKNPVLQIVQSDNIVESIPLSSYELVRKLYKPGSYDLRILYDANKNGVWDAGSFGKIKKQPEIVRLIPKVFTVRGNWDNEVTITL